MVLGGGRRDGDASKLAVLLFSRYGDPGMSGVGNYTFQPSPLLVAFVVMGSPTGVEILGIRLLGIRDGSSHRALKGSPIVSPLVAC